MTEEEFYNLKPGNTIYFVDDRAECEDTEFIKRFIVRRFNKGTLKTFTNYIIENLNCSDNSIEKSISILDYSNYFITELEAIQRIYVIIHRRKYRAYLKQNLNKLKDKLEKYSEHFI